MPTRPGVVRAGPGGATPPAAPGPQGPQGSNPASCTSCCDLGEAPTLSVPTSAGAAGGADAFLAVYSWESGAWTEAGRGPGSEGGPALPPGHHDGGLAGKGWTGGCMIRGPRRHSRDGGQKGPRGLPERGALAPGTGRGGGRGAGTQPLGTVQTGTGRGGVLTVGAPCPPPREASAAARAWPPAQGFAVGSTPHTHIWGPLLYFNACFYGNIYGTHVACKTLL